jgi:hypothetical protein
MVSGVVSSEARCEMKQAGMLAVLFTTIILFGCSNAGSVNAGSAAPGFSPVFGTWTGKSEVKGGDLAKFANSVAGGPLTGPSSMTLNQGYTGFLKIADRPERPIVWKQEGDRLILQPSGVNGPSDAKAGSGGPWVAKWSNENRTWTIDMDKVKVILDHHQSP